MKITSWNVNSIRARLGHVLDWAEENQPDLLCLQETKVQNEEFPLEMFGDAGWEIWLNGQRTYNGVAFISKHLITDIVCDTGDETLDQQKRFIGCTINGVRVYNLYVPNGKEVGKPQFEFKGNWYKAFTDFLERNHTPEEKIVVCGDFNIAPADIDTHDPEKWRGKVLFSDQEHQWLENLMDFGLTDSFRHLYPDEQAFTWWDYRAGGFPRNHGMRIDHHLVSKSLLPNVKSVVFDKEERAKERPSDHIPVTLELK